MVKQTRGELAEFSVKAVLPQGSKLLILPMVSLRLRQLKVGGRLMQNLVHTAASYLKDNWCSDKPISMWYGIETRPL